MSSGDQIRGKVAIVTGGGTGIGREIALAMARHGADVVIASRKVESLERIKAELIALGSKAQAIPTNIRNHEDVETLFARVKEYFGRVDILINNAGGQYVSKAEDISLKGWDAVLELNLNGTFYCCRNAAKIMIPQGSGRIVNIVNIEATERGAPGMAHSGAARAGVINLTRTLAYEWGRFGITLNAIVPGTIITEGMLKEVVSGNAEYIERLRRHAPMNEFATAREIAELCVFLGGDAAAHITGNLIYVDAGQHLGSIPAIIPDLDYGSTRPR